MTSSSFHSCFTTYNPGMDGVRDSRGLNGHGYDAHCPANHSAAYCTNYVSGYIAGWNSQHVRVPSLPSASTSLSISSSGGTVINKFNPNYIKYFTGYNKPLQLKDMM
jgi:hypothetical protein